ncbi:hypothetical protein DRP05_06560 [Archaeoglobales archaeon]|nr:MAG: hypothetical protein DRP05_06560 [Archaeoglobales archaeon]
MEFLFNPDKYFGEIKDKISYKVPLLIVTISGVLGSVNGYVVAKPMAKAVADMMVEYGTTEEQAQMIATFTQVSTILAPFIMAFILWFVMAIILHAVSALFNGKGEFSKTLKLSAFGYIPNIVFFPLNLYLSFETVKLLNAYGFAALNNFELKSTSISLGIVVMLWQFIYWVFIVKNARELEIRKAVITALVLLILLLIPSIYSLVSTLHF